MSNPTFYKTISGPGTSSYRVLGSRHIGIAVPVKTEEEIKSILDETRREHHNATHVCYAWRLGWDHSRFRSSDDGEPSGTAGKPILGQIQSAGLTNLLVMVVRYFGGTKLGTGGLIDAYKTASRQAIDACPTQEVPVRDHWRLTFTYENMPKVMKLLKDAGGEKLQSEFGEVCTMEMLVAMDRSVSLRSALAELEVKIEDRGRG